MRKIWRILASLKTMQQPMGFRRAIIGYRTDPDAWDRDKRFTLHLNEVGSNPPEVKTRPGTRRHPRIPFVCGATARFVRELSGRVGSPEEMAREFLVLEDALLIGSSPDTTCMRCWKKARKTVGGWTPPEGAGADYVPIITELPPAEKINEVIEKLKEVTGPELWDWVAHVNVELLNRLAAEIEKDFDKGIIRRVN